jgi:hypothetical protein
VHPDRLAPILDDLAALPRLELSYSQETEAWCRPSSAA